MKSSKLFYFLDFEWAFRKNPKELSRFRRTVQRRTREEREQRLREIDDALAEIQDPYEDEQKEKETADFDDLENDDVRSFKYYDGDTPIY